jgi:type II secretory pathway predicted ATPase ExeA/cell division protein FtsN
MILDYFNFRGRPFNLTLDLAYLFLGRHHEEAIAHLTYAVMEGEGFIAITGERGVGKTTVCRSFVEKLDANVATAFIDSSTSNPVKLLRDINAEFKIRSNTQSIKLLTDALNEFLMQKKLEGKKVAVFIDDAHKLSSDVLEQVRLISNLETSKYKLLQIVLIGEPQLSDMLDSKELRQIGQRVSVGYTIGPFTHDETVAYIQHRLSIASKGPPIRFDQKAVRRIHGYSGGIPRKINIACSQALELAHKRKQMHVDGDVANEAIRYLRDRTDSAETGSQRPKMRGLIATACCFLIALAVAVLYVRDDNQLKPSKQVKTERAAVVTASAPELSHVSPSQPPAKTKDQIKIESPPMVEPEMGKDIPAENFQVDDSGFQQKTPDPAPDRSSKNQDVEETDQISDVEQGVAPKMTHSVQVGAFLTLEYADNLIAKLAVKGYSPRIVEVLDVKNQKWYTVRIGDHPNLDLAQAQAKAFTQSENMQTAVRPYNAL